VTAKALTETRLRLCPVGSVVVVIRSGILAHTLPIAVTDVVATINQDLKAFDSGSLELNEWLALALENHADRILEDNRKEGTTVQSIRFDQLKAIRFPFPPLAEQRRIVAAVERILAQANAARGRLGRVPGTLKRFRQSVLAAACSGRLTVDWRARIGVTDEVAEGEDGISHPESWEIKRTAELVEEGTVISYGIVLPG
jgi:type I restriction enzyme S subunit